MGDDAGANRVIDIVVDVSKPIRIAHDLSLERVGHVIVTGERAAVLAVLGDAVEHFFGEVKAYLVATALQTHDHSQTLLRVDERAPGS